MSQGNTQTGTQTVTGTVALDAATLAALESITAVDGGGSLTVDSAQLPAALAAGGGLKVEGIVGGVAQPVSIAASVAVTGPLTDTQLRASAVPVSLASAPTTPVTNANLDVALSTRLKPADTLTGVTTVGTVTSITNAVSVTPPTLTKGTQGATGFSTQDLKDSGRSTIMLTAEFSPAATEALLTLSKSVDGATATTGTSFAITNGKRFRITSMSFAVENTLGTSLQRAYFRLRFAATGGALATSPLQATYAIQAAGTVKSITSVLEDYPDGIEYLGDGTKAFGLTCQAPDWVSATSTCKVYVTVFGFEY